MARKMSRYSKNYLECRLSIIVLSNRVASFTCPLTGNVRCIFTDAVNDLPHLQVLWQLCVPSIPLFNNRSMISYIPSLKTIISVSRRRHFM